MFILMLAVTFIIALVTSFLVVVLFRVPIRSILGRIVPDEVNLAWRRYIDFAIYIVGVSGGVRIWDLEKYITPRPDETEAIILNAERWTFEVYRTLIGTLQSIAWMLLVFFVFALIAYVIVRGTETKGSTPSSEK